MDDFTNALTALGVAPPAPAPTATPASSVDPFFLKAVIAQESGGNPNAVSPKGAQGVMQVMPATNLKPGYGVAPAQDNSEAERSRVGRDYLNAMHARYKDPALAAIAYNMGPGATDQWLGNGGDFNKLPTETKNYVGSVMTRAAINSRQGAGQSAQPVQTAPTQAAAPVDDDFSGALSMLSSASAAPASPAAPQQVKLTPSQIEQQASMHAPGSLRKPGDPIDPHAPISSPAADLTLNQITGLGSTVAGGFGGLYSAGKTLLQTGDVGKAVDAGANTVNKIQEAGTYQPRTEQGKKMIEGFGSNWNPLSWIPNASSAIGDKAGAALENAGYPAAGAVVKGAGGAAPMALGFAAKPLSGMLKGAAEVPEVARVEPTMNPAPAAGKPLYKLIDGKPVLIGESPPPQTVVPAVQPTGAAPMAVNRAGAPEQPVAAQAPKPTLAEATPELQQAVSTTQAKGTPINPEVLSRHLEADTLPIPVKMTAGQASMKPALISEEMNGRGKAAPTVSPDFYNAQGKALGANLDELRARAAPDITATHPAEIGQILVDQYKAMDAPIQQAISAKYKALEQANGGQFPLSGQDFMTAADAAMQKKNNAAFLPPEIKSTLAPYRNGGPMTFNNFENLRTILATAARKADAASDGNAAKAISTVRDTLESLPMTGEAATIKPLADAARSAAKARFDALKADPAYKAAVTDSVASGEPSPLADNFVKNYLINGKGANVKQMKSNLSGSDTANQAISAAGIDYLKGLSGADPLTGKFLADRYNKGLNQLGPKLGDMFDPKTGQLVQQVGNVAKYTSAQPKGSYVNNSNTLVGAMSDAAKGTLEGVVNVGAAGIPVGTWIRKAAQNRSAAKASRASVEPGAGMKLSDLPGSRP